MSLGLANPKVSEKKFLYKKKKKKLCYQHYKTRSQKRISHPKDDHWDVEHLDNQSLNNLYTKIRKMRLNNRGRCIEIFALSMQFISIIQSQISKEHIQWLTIWIIQIVLALCL